MDTISENADVAAFHSQSMDEMKAKNQVIQSMNLKIELFFV